MNGRVALITGCGKPDGGGQAIARALAADGAAVVVSDRVPTGVLNRRQEIVGSDQPASWSGLDSLVAEIEAAGGTAMSVLGDIGDDDDAQAMVDAAVERDSTGWTSSSTTPPRPRGSIATSSTRSRSRCSTT